MGCKKPERVIIPQTVEYIGDYAFFECTGLREVVTPGSLDRIGNAAFTECSMTALKILDGVKSIDNLAFQNCLHLRDVLVPDSVTEVGFKVFAGCEMLKSVRIKNYKSKEGFLPDCSMLERLDNGNDSEYVNVDGVVFNRGTSEGILIRGKKGSEAERYARKNGCAFENAKEM